MSSPTSLFSKKQRRHFLALAAGPLLLFTPFLHAEWAKPEGFFEKEKIERREVAPGIEWIAARGEREGKPIRTHILAVDLKTSGVTLRNLFGSRQMKADSRQRVARSGVSQLAQDNGALAAINTAFFDIKGTQTPAGLLIHNGRMLRNPEGGQPTLLLLKDGTVAIREAEWIASVQFNGKEYPLSTVNSPYLPDGKFALFQRPWLRTPGRDGFPQKKGEPAPVVTEIVLSSSSGEVPFEPGSMLPPLLGGAVREVRRDQPSVPIGTDEAVLAYKGELPFEVSKGSEITVKSELRFSAWSCMVLPLQVVEGFSGQPLLVQNGESRAEKTKSWTDRHPRSAVGIDEKGEKMLLVAVDGRSDESAGMALETLAGYLIHIGSDTAFNFDGGGSTALGAVVDGQWRIFNHPSDGSERSVPVGLGLIPAGKGKKE